MLRNDVAKVATGAKVVRGRPAAAVRFDWLVAALALWGSVGVYYDGWAHTHIPQLETFFTPYHAMLYSGFLSVAVALAAATVHNRRQGYPWGRATPSGYELSLLGAGVFLVAGAGDMIWHILFGIEADVDALLSPTHLLLATGGGLMVTGPLRSLWHRLDGEGNMPAWSDQLPAVLSMAMLLGLFAFFTQYAHPWAHPFAANGSRPATDEEKDLYQSLGSAGILLGAGFLMGVVLPAIRRWRLPAGAFTLLLGLDGLMMGLMRDQHEIVIPAILAGIGADLLYGRLTPSVERPVQFRLFAFGLPVLLYGFYFLGLQVTGGIWWSIHLWAGSVVIGGIAGWLMSYLVLPPGETR